MLRRGHLLGRVLQGERPAASRQRRTVPWFAVQEDIAFGMVQMPPRAGQGLKLVHGCRRGRCSSAALEEAGPGEEGRSWLAHPDAMRVDERMPQLSLRHPTRFGVPRTYSKTRNILTAGRKRVALSTSTSLTAEGLSDMSYRAESTDRVLLGRLVMYVRSTFLTGG